MGVPRDPPGRSEPGGPLRTPPRGVQVHGASLARVARPRALRARPLKTKGFHGVPWDSMGSRGTPKGRARERPGPGGKYDAPLFLAVFLGHVCKSRPRGNSKDFKEFQGPSRAPRAPPGSGLTYIGNGLVPTMVDVGARGGVAGPPGGSMEV